ncbi:MAG: hypothetical protein FJ299_13555 [Planctomycetes bacterium]|nr:hypothetical protein [Planctomycetota bacterium]
MKSKLLSLLAAAAFCAPFAAQEIDVYVSVKWVLNSAGNRPLGLWDNEAAVQSAIEQTNQYAERMGRGYRYVVIEMENVSHAPTSSWQYFDLYFDEFKLLESTAKANAAAYFWRTNAVNIYIVNSCDNSGGLAAIPSASSCSGSQEEIVVFKVGMTPELLWPHELGHHFSMIHTFDDDGCADTKFDPELSCVADFSCTTGGNLECCCSTKLTLLNAQNYSATDKNNLLYNVMSYYGANDCVGPIQPPHDWSSILMTSDQLDRWSDATRKYCQLNGEVSGYTYFVDKTFGGTSTGYSTSPYKTVQSGYQVASASPGNILNLRPGNYAETLTFTAPVTLRASRGNATIGQ